MLTYQSILDHEKAAQVAELFATLGDASRVRIIAALIAGEKNVSSLTELAGISQSAVSHHLRILRQMRFVKARKDGREVFYRLDDEHVSELFQHGVEHIMHA
jgi:ArsR family transcriptional regulator, lead/cadmium/zinc/bismuth-responsive transcriptional repressor